MVGIIGSEERQARPVHSDFVEMAEVRIAPALPGIPDEVECAALVVDAQHLIYVPFPGRDLVLEPPGGEIVEVELSPVVALGEPDHFVGPRENAPVHESVSRLELGRDILTQHVANLSGGGIGDTQDFVLVVARRGDERELRSVGIPLNISPPFVATTDDVIAKSRSVRTAGIPDESRGPSTSMMTRWIIAMTLSPGSGYFHALEMGWPALASTRYISPTARSSCWNVAIFFESDQTRMGRSSLPTRRCLSVAEVLRADRRQLRLPTTRDVAHPQVVSTDEGRALPVGRDHLWLGGATRIPASEAGQLAVIDRSTTAVGFGTADHPRPSRRIDEDELASRLASDPIAEAVSGNPNRLNTSTEHERRDVVAKEPLCSRVIGRRQSR